MNLSLHLQRWAVPALLLVLASPAWAQQKIADQLEEARAAVERIATQEGDVLEEVERFETALREAQEAAELAAAELESARQALAEAQAAEARTARQLEEQGEALAPRLRARYRMHRQGGAGALLGAESPAAWLRLQRTFDELLAADLAALRELEQTSRAHAEAARALEAAQVDLEQRAEVSRLRAEEAEAAAATRQQLLASVREEKRLRQQVVRGLVAAQRRLDGRLARLRQEASIPKEGFGRLRGKLPMPVEGAVVEVTFGKVVNARFHTVTHHNGVDLRVHEGAEVRSVGEGRVAFAGWFRGYGNLVIVDHGAGFHTLYAHLAAIGVKEGEDVEAGTLVGLVGDTGSLKGAYLYFELRANGKPLDPMPWFAR